ncbi:MAG TPA: hypothetical protein VNG12_12650 [Acidimicrobiales bacterium]|nr:hypothetical protein [Acidimicrobiales bacterium]
MNVEGNLSYSYLADLARDRADYCRNMKHPASQLAMQYWSRVGETCSLRARLYNSSTGRLGRARIAYQLSRMGYALASGSGRPWAAFLKDLTIGILMNRSVDPGT